MKRLIFIIILISMFLCCQKKNPTEPDIYNYSTNIIYINTINNNTVITNHNNYINKTTIWSGIIELYSIVYIESGSILIINPGTDLKIHTDAGLRIIDGDINFNGNINNFIKIYSLGTNYNIELPAYIDFNYCYLYDFVKGFYNITFNNCIISNIEFLINDCDLYNSDILINCNISYSYLSNCFISSNAFVTNCDIDDPRITKIY